jgi:hypothetical protein
VRKASIIAAAVLVCLPSFVDPDTVAYEISALVAWALVAIGLVFLGRWGAREFARRRRRGRVSDPRPRDGASVPSTAPRGQPAPRRHEPVRVPQHGPATQRCTRHHNKRKFATEADAESFVAWTQRRHAAGDWSGAPMDHSYKCPLVFSNHWHVSSKPRRRS